MSFFTLLILSLSMHCCNLRKHLPAMQQDQCILSCLLRGLLMKCKSFGFSDLLSH